MRTRLRGGDSIAVSRLTATVDGIRYDLSEFRGVRATTEVCLEAFFEFRSRNTRVTSRDGTNKTLITNIHNILRYALECHRAGDVFHFDYDGASGYLRHLRDRMRPSTTASSYAVFRRIAVYAMESGRAQPGRLPRGDSYQEALYLTRTRTLADHLATAKSGRYSQVELNEQLIKQLNIYCWSVIRLMHARLIHGRSIRAARKRVSADMVVKACEGKPAPAALRDILLAHLWHEYNGFIAPRGLVAKCTRPDQSKCVKQDSTFIIAYVLQRSNMIHGDEALDYTDIRDHLWPTAFYLAPFMVLFAIAQVNSLSIHALKTNDFRADPTEPTKFMTVFWPKPRSNAQLLSGPYPIGGKNSRSLPRAWMLLQEATRELRELAPVDLRDYAFIQVNNEAARPSRIAVSDTQCVRYAFTRGLALDIDPANKLLREAAEFLSLKTVRTTSMNLTRNRSDIRSTSMVAGHRNLITTDGYLSTLARGRFWQIT